MALLEKKCFRCGKTLPLEAFYRHPRMDDGHLGKCKECTKLDVRENYALRRKQYRDYDKKRNQTPKRKVSARGARIKYRKKDPVKYKAHSAASNAIRNGKLIRENCFYCGNPKSQIHHDDYSKPLDVRWVCFKCHREKEHGQVVLTTTFGLDEETGSRVDTQNIRVDPFVPF